MLAHMVNHKTFLKACLPDYGCERVRWTCFETRCGGAAATKEYNNCVRGAVKREDVCAKISRKDLTHIRCAKQVTERTEMLGKSEEPMHDAPMK
jgi:hypothetical protein